jgi:hypothetical protein
MPLEFTSEKEKIKNKKEAEKNYVRYFLISVAVISAVAALSFGVIWPFAFSVVTVPFILWNEMNNDDDDSSEKRENQEKERMSNS